ncbi:MAG: NYN domain-containing protein [Chloroflexi bacterium]|nr:NYN domain-containing protein [Chloroflexota bacterium]
MNEHHVILDWDATQRTLREQGSPIEPDLMARSLMQLCLAIGGELEPIALVSYHDQASMPILERAGFQVRLVNGSRPQALEDLENEFDRRVLDGSAQPFCVTLVTPDPALEKLARRATLRRYPVRVWGPSNTPHELRKPEYHFRPLEDLLPELRVRRVVILIDWENIAISLAQAGLVVNPETVAEAFKQRASRYGKLLRIYAYADWGALGQNQGEDVQRLLEMAGVETRYEISMRGKSSSDMRIVDKVHQLLQGIDPPDVLILASGDRDYRALIETAKRRFDKMVVLWGKKGTVNPMVSEVADEVEWVDDFLPLPHQRDFDSINRSVSRNENTLVDPLAELALRVEGLFHSQEWQWVSPGKLLDYLVASQNDPHVRSSARNLVNRAKAEGVLLGEYKPNPHPNATQPTIETLSSNPNHPSVKAARLVKSRVQDRVRYALEVRRMPYVTFSYIANGMEMDTELKRAGLARIRAEQTHWLNLMVETGLLVKERRTTPQNCTVLWLPKEKPAPTATDDPEMMIRRLVTSADTFMAQRGLDWVPLKSLHQRLERFGNTIFLETVEHLIQTGEAKKQPHENPNRPHPTMGLHLNPQGPTVAIIRQERERVITALGKIAEANQSLSPENLQAHFEAELQLDACTRWMEVLTDEGVLLKQGDEYHLNHNHALLSKTPEVEVEASLPDLESSTIRRLLTEALDDEQLRMLAFDHFREVYERFAEGMTKSTKVHLLIEYAERKELMSQLLTRIRELNPIRFKKFVPQVATA